MKHKTWRTNGMVVHSIPKKDTETTFAFEVHEDPRRDLEYQCSIDKRLARSHDGPPSWMHDLQQRAAHLAAESARTAFFEARRKPAPANAVPMTVGGMPVQGMVDMYGMEEDARITMIAKVVAERGQPVRVLVDDRREKIDRYTRKLQAAGCVVLSETPGPTTGAVLLRVGPQ